MSILCDQNQADFRQIEQEGPGLRVAILGAGIAGLTAAHELAKAGRQVTVYEAAAQGGGLASGFRDRGWDWPLERFYHHLFTTDSAIRGLVDEIAYSDKLFFRRQITSQWWQGRPYPVQGGMDRLSLGLGPLRKSLQVPAIVATGLSVVSYPGLPLTHRLRMGAVSAYLKYAARDWRPLERWTAADWTRRWMGETIFQTFVHPLLEGKFGPYADEVNMAWLWARLKTRSFLLGYFIGGFQGFADALLDHVRRAGVRVELGSPVRGLALLPDGGWKMTVESSGQPAFGAERHAANGETATFDSVIVTLSPSLLSRLVPQLPTDYLNQIQELRSLGAVVMTIALRRPITKDVYWMNVPKDEFPFLALVEHTNFVEPEHYGGNHLVYCGDYLEPSHEYFSLTQDQLLERFLPALKRVNPAFEPSWIRDTWLHRETYAQPIVPINHSRNVPALRTPLPGLYWTSMSQVYPWDRGTNFAVELGQRVAREILFSGHP